jgi:hypothetical protein
MTPQRDARKDTAKDRRVSRNCQGLASYGPGPPGAGADRLGVAAFLTGYWQVRAPLGPMRNERTIRSGESGEQDVGRSSADYETWRLNSELANARPQSLYLATALRATCIRRTDSRSGQPKTRSTNAHRPVSGWSIDGDLPLKPRVLLHPDSLSQVPSGLCRLLGAY